MPTPKPSASSQSTCTLMSPRVSSPSPGNADVEVEPRAGVDEGAAEVHVPLHEDVFRCRGLRIGDVDVGVQDDVGDVDRAARVVTV